MLPPRSRVAAITGAASGVLMVAAKRAEPADQQAPALDLGVAGRCALLLASVNAFFCESMSTNTGVSLPGRPSLAREAHPLWHRAPDYEARPDSMPYVSRGRRERDI